MKLVYLIQGRDNPEQAVQLANALSIDDYVVLTLNDSKWIDEAYYLFNKHRNVHLSTSTAFATVGDLSAPRTWLYQLKEATEKFRFDYAINLTENTMPTLPREELISYLQQYEGANVFTIHKDTASDEAFKNEVSRYYLGTNSNDFALKEKYRNRMMKYAKLLHKIGFKRKLDFTVYKGDPWFALTYNTSTALSNELKFASQHFILSWFPERFIIQTMFMRFVSHQPRINNVLVSEDSNNASNKPFRVIKENTDRKEIATILHHYNEQYEAPYDFVAEEIEVVKKGMLDHMIAAVKKKFKK